MQEGADIIEIGGQSTGPGSKDVPVAEELRRTIPVIDAIASAFPNADLSIDTFHAQVAHEAIAHGATMVNDVTAGRGDLSMFEALAKLGVPVVLMYAKDHSARTTMEEREYEDVIETIASFLKGRMEAAEAAGIARSRLIIDPGLGHFLSANTQYSFEVIARLAELKNLAPIFLSPSRKSFLAGSECLPPEDRLPATIVASGVAVKNGATYIRTHDCRAVRRGCEAALRM